MTEFLTHVGSSTVPIIGNVTKPRVYVNLALRIRHACTVDYTAGQTGMHFSLELVLVTELGWASTIDCLHIHLIIPQQQQS